MEQSRRKDGTEMRLGLLPELVLKAYGARRLMRKNSAQV
jgi:hypothetical protein